MLDRDQTATLVRAAADGDRGSWDALVMEFAGSIWAIARSYHLSAAEAADVSQTTWLRLCENIDRLRDPGAIGAWLATTARRECAHQRSRGRAVVLVDDVTQFDVDIESGEQVDEALMREEVVALVREAIGQLPSRTQSMLSMLMQDTPRTYEEVAVALEVPVGTIGPTRGRAMRRLRSMLEASGAAVYAAK